MNPIAWYVLSLLVRVQSKLLAEGITLWLISIRNPDRDSMKPFGWWVMAVLVARQLPLISFGIELWLVFYRVSNHSPEQEYHNNGRPIVNNGNIPLRIATEETTTKQRYMYFFTRKEKSVIEVRYCPETDHMYMPTIEVISRCSTIKLRNFLRKRR